MARGQTPSSCEMFQDNLNDLIGGTPFQPEDSQDQEQQESEDDLVDEDVE